MQIATELQAGQEPAPGYRLLHPLGSGGFGFVWEARRGDGEHVALKFLPCRDDQAAAREVRAIQAVRGLHHPGLVCVHQVWCQPGYLVISMELAEGTLADLHALQRAEYGTLLDPKLVCQYMAQAAEALDFLNARRHAYNRATVAFQHCDVKPGNILLFGDVAKLSDFGLATPTSVSVRPHVRAGTLGYAAPEVFRGQLSNQTDQYALAVSYYELRTGRLPFPDAANAKRPWSAERPEPELGLLSAEERPVLARALARVPQDRWPTCRELIERLARAVRPKAAGESCASSQRRSILDAYLDDGRRGRAGRF